MASNASATHIVKVDEGAINARILARETKVDFRRIEAASVKVVTQLASAEGKRLFVRFFSTLQLNAHFISVLARTKLDAEDVAKVEATIKSRLDSATQKLNEAIDGAEALFRANGIASPATYDAQPLMIEVGLISSVGRRYLELISKLDQLMPLLQTLEIHEVISTRALDIQRAALKRQVRDVANSARSLASGLRRRMNIASGGAVASARVQTRTLRPEALVELPLATDAQVEEGHASPGSRDEDHSTAEPDVTRVIADHALQGGDVIP